MGFYHHILNSHHQDLPVNPKLHSRCSSPRSSLSSPSRPLPTLPPFLPRPPASPPPTPLATRPVPPPLLAAPAVSLACCARSTFLVASAPTTETPTAARTAQTVSSSTSRTALPSCKLVSQQLASDTRPKSPVYTGGRRQGGYEAIMRSLVFGNFGSN